MAAAGLAKNRLYIGFGRPSFYGRIRWKEKGRYSLFFTDGTREYERKNAVFRKTIRGVLNQVERKLKEVGGLVVYGFLPPEDLGELGLATPSFAEEYDPLGEQEHDALPALRLRFPKLKIVERPTLDRWCETMKKHAVRRTPTEGDVERELQAYWIALDRSRSIDADSFGARPVSDGYLSERVDERRKSLMAALERERRKSRRSRG